MVVVACVSAIAAMDGPKGEEGEREDGLEEASEGGRRRSVVERALLVEDAAAVVGGGVILYYSSITTCTTTTISRAYRSWWPSVGCEKSSGAKTLVSSKGILWWKYIEATQKSRQWRRKIHGFSGILSTFFLSKVRRHIIMGTTIYIGVGHLMYFVTPLG